MSSNPQFTWSHGGVIRAPRDRKRLSLIFTGGHFGEGIEVVLDALARRKAPGSFFFTGDFLHDPKHVAAIHRLVADGHYLGPHGHAHLLYCPWEDRSKTLVRKEEFTTDLHRNMDELQPFGFPREKMTWWIPPYEWYNDEISAWSVEAGIRLFNFSPGTLSHTDYTEDDAKNFRSSQVIYHSILDYEKREADGLNGFLLLTHVGAGAKRTDKFFLQLEALLVELEARGYTFERVDEILADAPMEPEATP